jgi:dTMP kinase
VHDLFITFEGPEGGGKSTQIERCSEWLASEGYSVVLTREPGGQHALGEGVRNLLLGGEPVVPIAEMFLFLADRAQHVAQVIVPALERGEIVLCDRHADSTTVYQGIARGLGRERAEELNRLATCGLEPDLTILLDIPPEVGLARLIDLDRLDREALEFHRTVREGFLALAAENPRYCVIDASQSLDEVAGRTREAIAALLSARGYNRVTPTQEGP